MRKACCVLALVLIIGLAGCGGPKIVPVSGQVLMNGEPLKVEGFVRFEPRDARPAIGKIDPETGRFTLTTFEDGDGCLVGEHKVAVIANVTIAATGQLVSLIPEKYSDANTSGLKVNIEEPTDSLEIELTGELKKAPKQRTDMLKGDDPGL